MVLGIETSLIDSEHRQDLKIQSVQNSKRKVFNERTKVKNPWCHDDGATKQQVSLFTQYGSHPVIQSRTRD